MSFSIWASFLVALLARLGSLNLNGSFGCGFALGFQIST